jgi:hypothetical protein
MTRNHYDANELVQQACAELGYNLCDLIALTTFWVHPQVLRLLSPVQGVWFPNRRRANLGLRVAGKPVEKVGDEIGGVVLDDNTYANTCFKRALGLAKSQIVGFEVCHIWPGTAYDPRYYTQLANLVAIPRELASLTDHSCDVLDCLKYRAWELYCWKPDEVPIPSKPAGYPLKWRAPLPCNRKISNAIFRRLNRNVLEQRTGHTGSAAAAMGHFDKALDEAAFMNVQRKGRRFWTANRDGRTYRFSVRFSGFSRSRQGWWYTFYDVDDDFAQVMIWRVETGDLVLPPLDHGSANSIVKVLFNGHGDALVSVAHSRTAIRFWDIATGSVVWETDVRPQRHRP